MFLYHSERSWVGTVSILLMIVALRYTGPVVTRPRSTLCLSFSHFFRLVRKAQISPKEAPWTRPLKKFGYTSSSFGGQQPLGLAVLVSHNRHTVHRQTPSPRSTWCAAQGSARTETTSKEDWKGMMKIFQDSFPVFVQGM